jgi:hypothetical protein
MGAGAGPWDDWYHCMGHTYGTWLPGDPRGHCPRHHREHVEGDCRAPPPRGARDGLYAHARASLTRAPVHLDAPQRERALYHVVSSLLRRDVVVRIASLDAIHLHVLAQFRDRDPRHWVGIAKKESSHYLKTDGIGIDGGLWAVRSKDLPATGAAHVDNIARYIREHELKGAMIWEPDLTPRA